MNTGFRNILFWKRIENTIQIFLPLMTWWLMFDSAPPQKVWDLLLLNVNFQQQFPVTLMNVMCLLTLTLLLNLNDIGLVDVSNYVWSKKLQIKYFLTFLFQMMSWVQSYQNKSLLLLDLRRYFARNLHIRFRQPLPHLPSSRPGLQFDWRSSRPQKRGKLDEDLVWTFFSSYFLAFEVITYDWN